MNGGNPLKSISMYRWFSQLKNSIELRGFPGLLDSARVREKTPALQSSLEGREKIPHLRQQERAGDATCLDPFPAFQNQAAVPKHTSQ